MKMYLGGTPVKTMKVKHFEVDTNSATVEPSAVQAGLIYFAKGRQEVGTGKAFAFASYGSAPLNSMIPIPVPINVVWISSTTYPVRSALSFTDVLNVDFSTNPIIAYITVDGTDYPINLKINKNIMTISCDYSTLVELFYGKDEYA